MGKEVHIIHTEIANIASVRAAFERLGVKVILTNEPSTVSSASFVVLPGVGAFGPGMKLLDSYKLIQCFRERVESNLPSLAICLGLQLLFESSEESPGTKGISLFQGHVEHFSKEVRCPHFGWNDVEVSKEAQFLRPGQAYFANSYCIRTCKEANYLATTNYDTPFISALEYKNLLACQFHPELSGQWGESLLRRWVGGTE